MNGFKPYKKKREREPRVRTAMDNFIAETYSWEILDMGFDEVSPDEWDLINHDLAIHKDDDYEY